MANEIRKTDALVSLKPKAEWTLRGETLEWLDDVQTEPTQSEIDAEIIRLDSEYDAQDYARNRKAEYPDIGDQLDMIYHNGDGGVTFQAAIKAVKDKYPKE